MKIYDVVRTKINLEEEEIGAIESVLGILSDVMKYFGDDVDIMSELTGEVISTNELPRVRGILSALMDNQGEVWEVEK